MTPELLSAYRFFREWAGGIVGESAKGAIALARAERTAAEIGLTCDWEHECDPWDGESPAPEYLLCGIVRDRDGIVRASLGMVGVNSTCDPYLRVCVAEMYHEAIDELATEQAREFSRRVLDGARVDC